MLINKYFQPHMVGSCLLIGYFLDPMRLRFLVVIVIAQRKSLLAGTGKLSKSNPIRKLNYHIVRIRTPHGMLKFKVFILKTFWKEYLVHSIIRTARLLVSCLEMFLILLYFQFTVHKQYYIETMNSGYISPL